MKFQSYIGFKLLKKLENNDTFLKIPKFLENDSGRAPALRVVDGSPLVAIAKRKSREPRTQMHLTMKIMFLSVIVS